MGYLHNVRKQLWVTFFHALIPAYVIERLFWQQRGISVQMVVYCEIIYAVTVTLLEIPSGVLADKFGRKKLICMSAALTVAELAVILFAHRFRQFAFAVFLAGIGKAFFSGSENALLYDSLKAAGRQAGFEKLLGRILAVDFTGSVLAALSGGVLAGAFGFDLNYIVSIVSTGVAFGITLFLKEPPAASPPEPAGVLRHTKQAFGVYRAQPLVLLYCLTGIVLGACFIYLDEFWQILAEAIGIPVLFFGVISAVSLGIRVPGNLLAHKLKGKISYHRLLTSLLLVNIAGYLAVFVLRNAWCLIPVFLVSLTAGITDPLILGYLHHHTESRVRATAESVFSLGLRVMSIGVGLLFGYISTRFSIFAGFLLLGCVGCVYFVFYLARQRRYATDE